MMKRTLWLVVCLLLMGAQATPTPVLAEALQEALVHMGPGADYDVIGSIRAGAQYPVTARHRVFSWVRITFGDPVQPGWVHTDTVAITGDLDQVPPIDTEGAAPQPGAPVVTATPPPAAAAPPNTGVTARPIDYANLRCGPGTEYPQVGVVHKGEAYPVLRRHIHLPWVEIAYASYQTGTAWIYVDLVEIEGDPQNLPGVQGVRPECPLTPTPAAVESAQSPWGAMAGSGAAGTPVDMAALGDRVMNFLYEKNYLPRTQRQASVFAYDLQTGQGFALNPGIAYSGMSLIKIPLLVTYFRALGAPPNSDQAYWITGMMTCSNNPSSNAIMRELGSGDPFVGAERVTETMRELGLANTFLQAPLVEDPDIAQNPDLVPIRTEADQVATNPDLFNQTTMEDIGWLLAALYQCGQEARGPLLERIDGLTPVECRRILYTLDQNDLGAMIEAGVPEGMTVAHKHGWTTAEDHADAGIVFSPGGDFVLALALHQHRRLDYLDAWPNIAEIARMVYNTFNPDVPLDAIHPKSVPETCEIEGHPLLQDLARADLPPLE